ncbi:molecular chaperone HtpG [Herbihabitans rhizosphaerae]|uniref:Molecular chaperone HtpG n=1 Tax=Herbihabitans rhizosphaerae TaxID=1872711 RepID=A0A4Q7KRQ3_9PSEU|nr:HSP90 family protein [Herbihabitans rhizosphaerae]RZS39086.1 molecular chaperone HtpG [Herbihabitans rhizosphaerae]
MLPQQNFQVDLRGVVDLLSHHLYSSPRVYVRELMQNAVDAITARRRTEPHAPATIGITVGDGRVVVEDSGVGLTPVQVREFLATIGRSSKRDDLGFARHEFLGQFGIGLLSGFLVADQIRLTTRAAGSDDAVAWVGNSDGTYTVSPAERDSVGTTVTLSARQGAEQWFEPPTVAELAALYGSMLPFEVTVNGTAVSGTGPPWRRDERRPEQRTADLVGHAQDVFGMTPFDVVELDVPEAGLTGVAYVLPFAANPAARAGHRVYLKRMLLSENADGLLPDWGFFVRCVVDATELRPTASREALYSDDLLEHTREVLGERLRGWLVGLARTDPQRLARFLGIHHLGVKALALHDDEMLRLVEQWWPMETNVGKMTLAEFAATHGVVRYTVTAEDFRQLAGVAAAQNIAVVNGGYAYDSEIIERLSTMDTEVKVEQLDPTDLATRFESVAPAEELELRPFLNTAQRVLDQLGCEVVLRGFEPASLPVLYLIDRAAAFQGELRATREKADALWAGVLGAFDKPGDDRPQLVLNHRNPLVRRTSRLTDPGLITSAVEALYGQALLLGYHPIRPADAALLNRSFLGLLESAVPGEDTRDR